MRRWPKKRELIAQEVLKTEPENTNGEKNSEFVTLHLHFVRVPTLYSPHVLNRRLNPIKKRTKVCNKISLFPPADRLKKSLCNKMGSPIVIIIINIIVANIK